MKQERVRARKVKERQAEEAEVKVPERPDLSEFDDLLDEIDEVLEENAEDFVNAYRQKGGQ